MVLVYQVVHRSWRTLAPVVLDYRAITNPVGYPTKDAHQRLFSRVFVEVDTQLAKSPNREIDEPTALLLADGVRLRAGMLALTPGWHLELLLAYRRHWKAGKPPFLSEPGDMLLSVAYDIAMQLGSVSDRLDAAADADAAISLKAKKTRPLTSPSLKAVVRTAAVRAELEAQIDAAWATTAQPPSPLSRADEAHAFGVLDAFDLGADGYFTHPRADAHWAALVEIPAAGNTVSADQLGLSAFTPPRRPPLRGKADDSDDDWRPVDASILARLLRMIKNKKAVFPLELTPRAAFDAETAASAQPLGLAAGTGRLTMALGGRAVSGLTILTRGGSGSDGLMESPRVPHGIRVFANRWQKAVRGEGTLRDPGSLYAETRSFLEDPSTFYLQKLWTRVHTAGFSESPIATAHDAWSHIYGALYTTVCQIGTITGQVAGAGFSYRSEFSDSSGSSAEAESRGSRWAEAYAINRPVELVAAIVEQVVAEPWKVDIREFYEWCVTDADPGKADWARHDALWNEWCLVYLDTHGDQPDPLDATPIPRTLDDLPDLRQVVMHLIDLRDSRSGIGTTDEVLETYEPDERGSSK